MYRFYCFLLKFFLSKIIFVCKRDFSVTAEMELVEWFHADVTQKIFNSAISRPAAARQ